MDLNADKLLERKFLKFENVTLSELLRLAEEKNRTQKEKMDLSQSSLLLEKELRNKAELQALYWKKSYENQKEITSEQKKKSRKNGILYFAGGLVTGILGIIIAL